MADDFRRGDRDQPFLLPPDLRDWLPGDHLAWFVLDVVDQLDLAPFLRAYRADGHGHPAYDPKTLLGVLLYGYAIGVRSSRQIQRRCVEDLTFRVLAAKQTPDHVSIARFRVRHEQALAGFLVASLRLCAAAGLVRLGVVALDGTKVAANAATTAQPHPRQARARRSPRSCGRPPRSTSARTSSSGTPVATSSLRRWRPRPAGWRGCATPGPCWRPRRPNRSAATSSGPPRWRLEHRWAVRVSLPGRASHVARVAGGWSTPPPTPTWTHPRSWCGRLRRWRGTRSPSTSGCRRSRPSSSAAAWIRPPSSRTWNAAPSIHHPTGPASDHHR